LGLGFGAGKTVFYGGFTVFRSLPIGGEGSCRLFWERVFKSLSINGGRLGGERSALGPR
jgi:hypothetical protein